MCIYMHQLIHVHCYGYSNNNFYCIKFPGASATRKDFITLSAIRALGMPWRPSPRWQVLRFIFACLWHAASFSDLGPAGFKHTVTLSCQTPAPQTLSSSSSHAQNLYPVTQGGFWLLSIHAECHGLLSPWQSLVFYWDKDSTTSAPPFLFCR